MKASCSGQAWPGPDHTEVFPMAGSAWPMWALTANSPPLQVAKCLLLTRYSAELISSSETKGEVEDPSLFEGVVRCSQHVQTRTHFHILIVQRHTSLRILVVQGAFAVRLRCWRADHQPHPGGGRCAVRVLRSVHIRQAPGAGGTNAGGHQALAAEMQVVGQ